MRHYRYKNYRAYKKLGRAIGRRILNACKYSYEGFMAAYKSEPAFRQDLLIFFIGLIIVFQLDIDKVERVILVCSLLFIFIMELVNTAIEVVVDRISKERHPLSKKAKDIGSLLVFLSFVTCIIIWCSILL
jgi:diacylglycerol kinase (ATP)